jgi:hypothetical protein
MGRSHEKMTAEQKKEALDNAVATLRFLVENGFQGNITFPIYEGSVGKIQTELFMDPKLIPGLLKDKLKQGGDGNASG